MLHAPPGLATEGELLGISEKLDARLVLGATTLCGSERHRVALASSRSRVNGSAEAETGVFDMPAADGGAERTTENPLSWLTNREQNGTSGVEGVAEPWSRRGRFGLI